MRSQPNTVSFPCSHDLTLQKQEAKSRCWRASCNLPRISEPLDYRHWKTKRTERPVGRPKRLKPIEYLDDPSTWPEGPYIEGYPLELRLSVHLAKRLQAAIEGKDKEYIAYLCDISEQTIDNIAKGRSWGDLPTIARLEMALQRRLWGYEHRRKPEDW